MTERKPVPINPPITPDQYEELFSGLREVLSKKFRFQEMRRLLAQGPDLNEAVLRTLEQVYDAAEENYGLEEDYAHEDIRIRFEVEGESYKAIGFLKKDEDAINTEELLRRMKCEKGVIVNDSDEEKILKKAYHVLPLELADYELRVIPKHSRGMYAFYTYNIDGGYWFSAFKDAHSFTTPVKWTREMLIICKIS